MESSKIKGFLTYTNNYTKKVTQSLFSILSPEQVHILDTLQ